MEDPIFNDTYLLAKDLFIQEHEDIRTPIIELQVLGDEAIWSVKDTELMRTNEM